ncbi:asparagine synthase (glutamine-hydrolyzing) [Elioraea thermophila]|uniref:asparagine synthase (glutamine-hydrolyzing) n=1 Tax=Elioraea thermophila TaxID=2185104 RepID=UPI000DF16B60|nr:asparagine synthase (glutamine-hydrolyzing) [Elioraea thermophila]
MCGIAGLLAPSHAPETLARHAAAMADALAHRGPDSRGIWTDAEAGLAFAHTRLAILDLSPAGHQPMVSASGRFVIAYNGETYNTEELRAALPPHNWRGHSDTEVILEAIAHLGVEETARRMNAIAALAVWDRTERRLWLVRDRIGVKPLYWGRFGDSFLFGSELKALCATPLIPREVDPAARALHYRLGYIPAPHAIWRGVAKLEPGTILSVRAGEEPRITRYWDLREIAARGLAEPFAGAEAEAEERLAALLEDAVRRQRVADVPLGAFLSGGVDSSTVVALMGADGTVPKTFTIGFDDPGLNEAPFAEAVARHLGTDHTTLTVTEREALEVVPRLPELYDEPFADTSGVPTAVVCRLARTQATVALSGDGGDELFSGYRRYVVGLDLWRRVRRFPRPLRALGGAVLSRVPLRLADALGRALPGGAPVKAFGDRLRAIGQVLGDGSFPHLYVQIVAMWREPPLRHPFTPPDPADLPPGLSPLEHMRLFDQLTYLPEDILTKVDRASMAVGLEVRVPLLDHRVVEFAWSLPPAWNPAEGGGKRLLRRVLYRHVPRALIERPKQGFSPPTGAWLKGPLREWAEELLSPSALDAAGLDPAPIRDRWQAHLAGRADEQYRLWTVLMDQAWRRHWLG